MRTLLALLVPLAVQVFLFMAVFVASQGGGSFMGLLAIPVAGIAVLALLASGVIGARSSRPIGTVFLGNLAIAIVPPILLLLVRALER